MAERQRLLTTALIASVLALAPGAGESGDLPVQEGADLLEPFKQSLKAALLEGMQAGAPQGIRVCKERAPAIAASLSIDGVRMGRTSHRLRNPENTAPAWVTPALEAMRAEGPAAGPRSIELDNQRSGYVEPILTAPLCLACHGKSIAPETAARIDALYPDDAATGFEAGDLRGVFWVEYPSRSAR